MLPIAALALAQPCTSPVSPAEPVSPPTPRCWMQPGSEPTGSWGSLIIQRIKMMKWHEMKAWLNAYQNPQAGLIGRVIYLVLVSAFSFHAKSSSVVVSVGHGKQSTKLQAVKRYLATSWCRCDKINPDLSLCLYLFSSRWLEKQNLLRGVVSGCIGTAENSENMKKMVGAQNLSISCDRQPSNWEGKKKNQERREKPHPRHQNVSSPYLPETIALFFWPKKMRGVSPWKLVWNKEPSDTMQPHITGHSLQTKLK